MRRYASTRPPRPARGGTGTAAAAAAGVLALVGAALCGAPTGALGQTVEGLVIRWPESTAVADARVTALDSLGDRRAGARTDTAGRFRIMLPEPGRFRLRVTHPAHDTTLTRPVALRVAEGLAVEIRLGPRPDTVPPLVIRARDRSAWSYLRPYYRRLESYGDAEPEIFITRTELDSLGVSTIGRAVLLLARQSSFRSPGSGRSCPPAAFWNGLRMSDRWHPIESNAGRASTAGVEGIEIYHADHPRMPMNIRAEPCGAILIWTQPGPDQAPGLRDLLRIAVVLVVGVLLFLSVGS